MSVLSYGSPDLSTSQTPAALRAGAFVLVAAVHVAVIAGLIMSRNSKTLEITEEPAVMVSVIDAPVPQQARAQPQVQPQPQPAVPPPPPPPEPAVEPDPPPPPVVQRNPDAPVIKPRPKPQPPKPVIKPQPPKPQAAPVPPVPTPAPPVAAPIAPPTGTPDGAQQTNQAPRQAEPVMVNSIEFDGSRPVPVYPAASRMHREQGTVVVLVRISPQGSVDKATVETSSGFSRLDDAALTAARQARFKPVIRNGVAVPALAKLPFDFKMRN